MWADMEVTLLKINLESLKILGYFSPQKYAAL
jgi:hypothetical protein